MTRREEYNELLHDVADMSQVSFDWLHTLVFELLLSVRSRDMKGADVILNMIMRRRIPLAVIRHMYLLLAEARAEEAWRDWMMHPRRND